VVECVEQYAKNKMKAEAEQVNPDCIFTQEELEQMYSEVKEEIDNKSFDEPVEFDEPAEIDEEDEDYEEQLEDNKSKNLDWLFI
jgi:hypothetical protein